jgi:hypothetical protein
MEALYEARDCCISQSHKRTLSQKLISDALILLLTIHLEISVLGQSKSDGIIDCTLHAS